MARTSRPTATTSEIREVAERTVNDLGLQPYLNCGPISERIRDALAEELDIENAWVEDGNVRVGPEYAEHAYVLIPQGVVEGKAGDVVVDGSVQQFDREHYDDGKTWVCLEDKVERELPQVVVQGRHDPLHSHYVKRVPF